MVISNSNELTEDFVLSMQNLSSAPESVVRQRSRRQSQSSDAANDDDDDMYGDSTSQRRKSESTDMRNDSSTNRDVQFNADIVCKHGNLRILIIKLGCNAHFFKIGSLILVTPFDIET